MMEPKNRALAKENFLALAQAYFPNQMAPLELLEQQYPEGQYNK